MEWYGNLSIKERKGENEQDNNPNKNILGF